MPFLCKYFKIAKLQRSFVIFFLCIKDLAFGMENIYLDCMTKNADGTNKIVGPDEKYLIPINNPF